MAHGLSYKEFRANFRFRNISVYCWSRHKAHISIATQTDVQAPEGSAELSTGLDVQTLRGINRKLKALAQRAEKSGRMAYAINAYAAIGRNVELIQKLGGEQKPDGDAIPQMTVEQIETEIIRMCEKPATAEWLKVCLYKAGHRHILPPRIEDIPPEQLVKELSAKTELRQQVMDSVVAAQEFCDAGGNREVYPRAEGREP